MPVEPVRFAGYINRFDMKQRIWFYTNRTCDYYNAYDSEYASSRLPYPTSWQIVGRQ